MRRSVSRGFTLIELMIVIGLLAILIVFAAPSFVDTLDRRAVINATQALTGQIQQARSLAITRNTTVSMVMTRTSGNSWCFGLTDAATCDCLELVGTETDACTVRVPDTNERILIRADQTLFRGVELGDIGGTLIVSFEPTRGLRTDTNATTIGDSFTFQSPRGLETQVDVNRIGRISTCSPSGASLAGGIGPC
jgi:type IV fimbrial biogenesis protein FimT